MTDDTPTEVTPRILVENRLYRTRSCETIDHVAYDAVTSTGTIDNGPGYERDVIGYVDVPPHTQIGRFTDFDEFRDLLEDVAVYLHFKDGIDAGDE